MAKLLLILSLSLLYLISINHSSLASVVPDQREYEFEPIGRRINEIRVDENDEQEENNDEDKDDIMDAKELNQHLKAIHKKPDYNIFNEKVTQTLITEADKAMYDYNSNDDSYYNHYSFIFLL